MSKIPGWVHRCLDILEFHEAKVKEKGQTPSGRPYYGKEGWSIRETARELNLSLTSVSDKIILGRALRKKKDLAQFSYKYALKIARQL